MQCPSPHISMGVVAFVDVVSITNCTRDHRECFRRGRFLVRIGGKVMVFNDLAGGGH